MLPFKHTPSSSRKRSREQQGSVAADTEDDAIHEVPDEALLSKDAAKALAAATSQLTIVWEKKVLEKDVASTTYTTFQKEHNTVCTSPNDACC